MLASYKLSVIDGTVCIACTQTEFRAPQLITNHWPTTVRARDLAAYLDIPVERLSAAVVTQSMPGEYYARNPGLTDGVYCHGITGARLSLANGGRTLPVHTDVVDYPAPKNRGKKVEYRDGYWWKDSAKGWKRHEAI